MIRMCVCNKQGNLHITLYARRVLTFLNVKSSLRISELYCTQQDKINFNTGDFPHIIEGNIFNLMKDTFFMKIYYTR